MLPNVRRPMRHLLLSDRRTRTAVFEGVVRDLWMAERRPEAHHKRHHGAHHGGASSTGAGGAPAACRGASHREGVTGNYRVYDGRTTAYLGEFPDRGRAWAAADEHLIAEMLRRGGWVIGEYM